MLVRGITLENLFAAGCVASRALGNEIELCDVRPANKSGTAWRFRAKVKHLDRPGHRLHLHAWMLGAASRPRRSRHRCGHGYAHLFTAIYERVPQAVITTAMARYTSAAHVLVEFPGVLQRNIGSHFYPVPLSDACSCPTDEVETDTIEPWQWRLGEPELPSRENTTGADALEGVV
jgi:hypothetical protein